VSSLVGVDYFPDEGLMNHSLPTSMIDRRGKLAANIEANQFTANPLADLVQSELTRGIEGRKSQTRLARNEGLSSASPPLERSHAFLIYDRRPLPGLVWAAWFFGTQGLSVSLGMTELGWGE